MEKLDPESSESQRLVLGLARVDAGGGFLLRYVEVDRITPMAHFDSTSYKIMSDISIIFKVNQLQNLDHQKHGLNLDAQ